MPDSEFTKAANELKKSLKEEEVNRLRAVQNKLRQDNLEHSMMAKASAELPNSEEYKKDVDRFKDLLRLNRDRQQGYDTWITSANAILSLCEQNVVMGSYSNPLKTLLNKVGKVAVPVFGGLSNVIADKLTPDSKVTLPMLQHYVEFTDDNKLNIASLKDNVRRIDGKPFTNKQSDLLDTIVPEGVNRWLELNGYEEAAEKPKTFVHKVDKTELTKDKFIELRDDPLLGFEPYFKGACKMDIKQAKRPQEEVPPSPSPGI